ncbi:MAG: sodium/solute symporter [Pirellulales bacterium]|nr:sodium/solute symporter [Pirellulales bacterium]
MSHWLLLAASEAEKTILQLAPVDFVVIGIYFVVVLWIGFYLKKSTETSEDFFMAGRKMSAWIAGLSFISANLSSLETMGWSAMATQYGMIAAHAYFIGAIPAILFLAVVMMPFYYICKTHSVPGYLKLRYNEGSRVLAGVSFTFMTVLVCGANMFAMAKILNIILGWPMEMSIWVSSITVAIYVALGGLLSAVFNEVVQFFLIWLGTLLVPILGLIECGGWNKMIDRINSLNLGANFTSLWSNLGSANDNGMHVHWAGLVFGWGIAISFGYWCTDFLQVQRVMAAKSLRSASNGTIIGAAFKMLVPLIVTVPGLLGLAVLTKTMGWHFVGEEEAAITGQYSYNDVLPLLMARYLGPGLLGLGVTAMVAGFMSGMAGNISAFATVWTYDVYRPLLVRNAKDSHYVAMGRWCSIIGVVIAIGTAYVVMHFSNILTFFHTLVVLFVVPLFGVVILGMLWKQATPRGGFWGLTVGTIISFAIFFFVRWFPGGHETLMLDDFHDMPAIQKTLVQSDAPLAKYLASHLSPETKDKLKALDCERIRQEESEPWAKRFFRSPDWGFVKKIAGVKGGLANNLNALIEKESIYSSERFADVDLSEDLLKEAQEGATGKNLIRLNRRLLHAAYPAEFGAMQKWIMSKINPTYAEIIATSPKADQMGVNQFAAFWTLLATLGTVIMVSLFSRPKPDEELGDLVYGLKPLPDEGPCPWYERPGLWALAVLAVLIAVNIYFW